MKTIAEWQTAAYECARSKGFHDCRVCEGMGGANGVRCMTCNGTGLAPMTPTRIGSKLALIHCEIAEATECVVRGKMELYYTGPCSTCHNSTGAFHVNPKPEWNCLKPEGFGIELADVFLRLCDLAESLGLELDTQRLDLYAAPDSGAEETVERLFYLHKQVSLVEPTNVRNALDYVLAALARTAKASGVDLLAMAELKYQYNLTRPIMHGGKLL